ncbi:CpsB/CapC family capsule biosynthesis tyrosine phosphatase [Halopseudomonas laoshanensis]|uniref:tyrosine-protein phosphatase n=1 Tax=Halopseudomonas laoshanensis TaxID=2268758 RepID=UPI002934504A|nr:CpsB/CapC family capsule biosynthesis tyrosine phosphatase [Pseudomonas sp. NyZ704]
MIDLHCHLLPGIDDGPEDMQTALEMARTAESSGITHMVCTPHIHPGRYDNSAANIRNVCRQFAAAIAEAGIKVRVSYAAEVRFGSELMSMISEGSIPFVGRWKGRRVMLLEFPHGSIPFGAEQMTRWLLSRGVMPMIVHPERNKGFMQQPARLRPFIQQGCLLQLTAGSVAGSFGEPAQGLALDLIKQGVVTILASDAHNLVHRPPDMQPGLEVAMEILGERTARRLVVDTPWLIAEHHFI